MSQQQKVCPRCHTPAVITAQYCVTCGRQYRTVVQPPPTPDQTIFGAPPPYSSPQPGPGYAAPPPIGALDDTERNVSMLWTGVGLVLSGLIFAGSAKIVAQQLMLRSSAEQAGYAILDLLLFGWLVTFLMMRFRRLYLFGPGGQAQHDYYDRRRRLSVLGTVGIFGSLAFGLWGAGAEVYDHQQAQLRAERQQQAAAAQARLEATRNDSEARVEAARASAERARADAARAEMMSLREKERQQLMARRETEMKEAASREAAARAAVPAAGVPSRPTRVGRLPRRAAGDGTTWDPNLMPCGHQFARFLTQGSAGQEIGACEQGHLYRVSGSRWVPASYRNVAASGDPNIAPGTTLAPAPAPERLPSLQPVLPCGDAFAARPTGTGFGGTGTPQARCVRGHRFRWSTDRWVVRG